MLIIRDLCKTKGNIQLNHMDLSLRKGTLVSLICNMDMSDLLVRLIIGSETPAKGEILFDGLSVYAQCQNQVNPYLGLVLHEVGLYERMTVASYLEFFKKMLNSSQSCPEIMIKLGLMDVAEKQILMLSNSQKRRLNLAREGLKNLKLLVIQEPILNMDTYESKLILSYLEDLTRKQVAVLTISNAYKDALLHGGKLYSVDETGIKEIKNDSPSEDIASSHIEENPLSFKIEKIPAKIDERILLFNPVEIYYIESENGMSYLNVRGERFACTLTLKELEKRLQHFGFFMCHRSYLVNLQKIKEIITWSRNNYSLILDDKKSSAIPLSKNRIDELKTLINI